jgi:murein DD-endopeptidase MepM/ murein hydrolase activator NlpD
VQGFSLCYLCIMADEHHKKSLSERLRTRYYFIIRKEENFEEKLSIRLSPISLFLVTGGLIVLLIVLVIYLVAFTPLREYIPGYADVNVRKNLIMLSQKTDSLNEALKEREAYMENIRRILSGSPGRSDSSTSKNQHPDTVSNTHSKTFVPPSHADTLLRSQVESQDPYNISSSNNPVSKSGSNINDNFFFCPLKGIITNGFNPNKAHFGVDIVAQENEAIKATLEGTVILSTWTLATGNVIILQHANNLISVYEHNSVLLKKIGDYVKAGDVIAIIGNSGELTTGPHLHFELWYKGDPVNPQQYIAF